MPASLLSYVARTMEFIQERMPAKFVHVSKCAGPNKRPVCPLWPDWAIYYTLGNFSKPVATINLPKMRKGVKIFHFSSEISFGQLFWHLATFYWSHCLSLMTRLLLKNACLVEALLGLTTYELKQGKVLVEWGPLVNEHQTTRFVKLNLFTTKTQTNFCVIRSDIVSPPFKVHQNLFLFNCLIVQLQNIDTVRQLIPNFNVDNFALSRVKYDGIVMAQITWDPSNVVIGLNPVPVTIKIVSNRIT